MQEGKEVRAASKGEKDRYRISTKWGKRERR